MDCRASWSPRAPEPTPGSCEELSVLTSAVQPLLSGEGFPVTPTALLGLKLVSHAHLNIIYYYASLTEYEGDSKDL